MYIVSKSNPFGNGIEFREGEPIELVQYTPKSDQHPNGKLTLNPKALEILSKIWEPVSVLAIVGTYRRGKSWFANVLHGRHDGFALGSSTDGCTKGIWMWSQPFLYNNMRVIVLDCEGLEDPNQDQEWAIKQFLLCLTLSSTFIYNIPGVLTAGDVNKLYLMKDLQKFVQPPQNDNFLPQLVVLLRDVYLQHKKDPTEYFLETLKKMNPSAAEGIRTNFNDFDVYCLSHPGCKMDVLQNMHRAKTSDLDDVFVQAVTNAVNDIYQKMVPKRIDGKLMPGAAFCKFLEQVITMMNSPTASMHLSIPEEYEKTVQFIAQNAVREGLNYYVHKTRVKMASENFPMAWEQFNDIHAQCFAEALEHFNGKVIGSLTQVMGFMVNLQHEITEVATQLRKENSNALKEQATTVARNHWLSMIERRLKPGTPNAFANYEALEAAQEAFEKEFSKYIIPCPEVADVLNFYRTTHYTKAYEQMHLLGLYNEQLADSKKAELKHKQEQLKQAAEIQELRNRLDGQQKEIQEQIKAANSAHERMHNDLQSQRESSKKIASLLQEKDAVIARLENQVQELSERQPNVNNFDWIGDVIKLVATVVTAFLPRKKV